MVECRILGPEKEDGEGEGNGPGDDAVRGRHIVREGLESFLCWRQVRGEDEGWEES
jgi:hypothetical protein